MKATTLRMLMTTVKTSPLQARTGPVGSRVLGYQISGPSGHEGGKVVSPTHRPPLPLRSIPGTNFCLRMSRPQGHSVAGRTMKDSSDTTENRTRDVPVCSAVPRPTAPPRAP